MRVALVSHIAVLIHVTVPMANGVFLMWRVGLHIGPNTSPGWTKVSITLHPYVRSSMESIWPRLNTVTSKSLPNESPLFIKPDSQRWLDLPSPWAIWIIQAVFYVHVRFHRADLCQLTTSEHNHFVNTAPTPGRCRLIWHDKIKITSWARGHPRQLWERPPLLLDEKNPPTSGRWRGQWSYTTQGAVVQTGKWSPINHNNKYPNFKKYFKILKEFLSC